MIERVIEFSAHRRGAIIFLVCALALCGAWSALQMPLDALPDLSDTQVIIYSRWDRSPDLIEDQVTYPIVTAMLGAPKVKAVRGISDFGFSFVYVIFEDNVDLYWARSRTQEYLSTVLPSLPQGVRSELGPDATSLGWIFQYALVDSSGKQSPASLRQTQDFFLRYQLRSVPGVADVASVGGFVPQYQVTVDPARLRVLGIPFSSVVEAVRKSNVEASGRLLELGGAEFVIRGRGYLQNPGDLAEALVFTGNTATPVRIKDVATVTIGPDMRRGLADLDGRGDTVSGIVIMRQGGNVNSVIDAVKRKLADIAPSLPPGVRVVPVYDRSELIWRVIHNLRSTLIEITCTVVLVILIFLWRPSSALIPILTIPLTVLISFIPFHLLGLSFNIMSLGGIAIAIGALVDAAIVIVEQSHKKLEEWQAAGRPGPPEAVILAAIQEVGRPAFIALLIMAVAFLPVLALEGQEGRMFHPLAYAKSLTVLVAALLAITLDPALRLSFTRFARTGRAIPREEEHPITRTLMRLYLPALLAALRHKRLIAAFVLAAALVTVPVFQRLGVEFAPPLDEGVLLYMPSTAPGISVAEAKNLLQLTDARLKSQPEVVTVLGKAGRADTPTDTAPLSMLETIVVLKPRDQWPRPLSTRELIAKLDAAMQFPGVSNSWTMPVRGRIDMLSTGMRSPLGIKVAGPGIAQIQQIGGRAEELLRAVPGTRSVFAERLNDARYIDIQWRREALAQAGVSMDDAQATVQNAIGGENVSSVIQGRARIPVNVRLPRDARSNLDALKQVLVTPSTGGDPTPLGQLAELRVVQGPSMIRNENGLLTGYVYVDPGDGDPGEYIQEASRHLARQLQIPAGFTLTWSGQYESFQRVNRRLLQVVPLTLAIIALLVYWNTRSAPKTALVLLAVPFSAIGGVWSQWLLGYPVSPAVWVGVIALLGVDAETGMFMLLYLDLAWRKLAAEGRMRTSADLREAILLGSVRRIRPKFMTVATMFLGLAPVLWSTGAGAEVMKRIAAPMIGGLATSFLMELIVYPVLYERWRSRQISEQPE